MVFRFGEASTAVPVQLPPSLPEVSFGYRSGLGFNNSINGINFKSISISAIVLPKEYSKRWVAKCRVSGPIEFFGGNSSGAGGINGGSGSNGGSNGGSGRKGAIKGGDGEPQDKSPFDTWLLGVYTSMSFSAREIRDKKFHPFLEKLCWRYWVEGHGAFVIILVETAAAIAAAIYELTKTDEVTLTISKALKAYETQMEEVNVEELANKITEDIEKKVTNKMSRRIARRVSRKIDKRVKKAIKASVVDYFGIYGPWWTGKK